MVSQRTRHLVAYLWVFGLVLIASHLAIPAAWKPASVPPVAADLIAATAAYAGAIATTRPKEDDPA